MPFKLMKKLNQHRISSALRSCVSQLVTYLSLVEAEGWKTDLELDCAPNGLYQIFVINLILCAFLSSKSPFDLVSDEKGRS